MIIYWFIKLLGGKTAILHFLVQTLSHLRRPPLQNVCERWSPFWPCFSIQQLCQGVLNSLFSVCQHKMLQAERANDLAAASHPLALEQEYVFVTITIWLLSHKTGSILRLWKLGETLTVLWSHCWFRLVLKSLLQWSVVMKKTREPASELEVERSENNPSFSWGICYFLVFLHLFSMDFRSKLCCWD